VPPEARWSHLKSQAKQPTVGELVDDAMAGTERDGSHESPERGHSMWLGAGQAFSTPLRGQCALSPQ
jgi:hypothetical protein